MRMMMKITIPVEAGTRAVKDGTFAQTFNAFIAEHKPEAAYFLTEGGKRTALFFFDLKDQTYLPAISKPFFLQLDAGIEWCPALNLADLKVGLERADIT
jgi:hypothetical protein